MLGDGQVRGGGFNEDGDAHWEGMMTTVAAAGGEGRTRKEREEEKEMEEDEEVEVEWGLTAMV